MAKIKMSEALAQLPENTKEVLNTLFKENLSDDFLVDMENNKIHINFEKKDLPSSSSHQVVLSELVEGVDNNNFLKHSSGIGIIHLDFKLKSYSDDPFANLKIGELAEGSPTPEHLLEAKTSSGAVISIQAGEREIMAKGLQPHSQEIVTLIGFFNGGK